VFFDGFIRLIILLEESPIKVNKWNIQEVRVAFDDLVVKVFVFYFYIYIYIFI
jgi:hypothetical protein